MQSEIDLLQAMHQKLCQASGQHAQMASIKIDGDVTHYMPVGQVGVPSALACAIRFKTRGTAVMSWVSLSNLMYAWASPGRRPHMNTSHATRGVAVLVL